MSPTQFARPHLDIESSALLPVPNVDLWRVVILPLQLLRYAVLGRAEIEDARCEPVACQSAEW